VYAVTALTGPNAALSGTQAFGIASSGDIAGFGAQQVPGTYAHTVGMSWRAGAEFDLSLPALSESELFAVNAGRDRVGMRAIDTGSPVAILVRAGVMQDLPVGEDSLAIDISDAGLVCGSSLKAGKPFLYDETADALTWLDVDGYASAVNANGEVAGLAGGDRGYLWSNGASIDLGPAVIVYDVNDAGLVCGAIKTPSGRWAAAVCDARQPSPAFQQVPVIPGALNSAANAVNNAGVVVGGCWAVDPDIDPTQDLAFIYDGTQPQGVDLNTLIVDPGWQLQVANGINDAGHIVGTGLYYGATTPFLLTPPWLPRPPPVLTLPQLVGTLLGGVAVGGGGWIVVGGHPLPVGPWERWLRMPAARRDALIALALDEVAMFVEDEGVRASIRRTLIAAAEERLAALAASAGEGRPGPVAPDGAASGAPVARRGKLDHVLRRTGPR
jgi:uncharacterized membrane protein